MKEYEIVAKYYNACAGASRPEQVQDNIKAAQNTVFTEEELAVIDQISL